jgi:hypothetical protein
MSWLTNGFFLINQPCYCHCTFCCWPAHNIQPTNNYNCTQLTVKTTSLVLPEDWRLTPETCRVLRHNKFCKSESVLSCIRYCDKKTSYSLYKFSWHFLFYLNQSVTSDCWWYHMFNLAFYCSWTVSHFFDVKRKDFWQMFAHHVTTVLLIIFTWVCHLHRIASLVLLVHDCAHIFSEVSWMCLKVCCEF